MRVREKWTDKALWDKTNPPKQTKKKRNKINYKQQKLQNWVGFVLAINGWSIGLPLSLGYIHSEILLEKTKFFLVSIYQLGLGMETCVHFSSQPWDPICLSPVEALGMLPQSLWVHMCVSLVMLGSCFFRVFHPHWHLHSFCCLFRIASWALGGGI